MAWIYLAESVDSHSPWRPGSDQLPTVRTTDMHRPSSCPEWPDENCQSPQFGMTCRRLLVGNFNPMVWMLSGEDFRARTSVSQELDKAWRASDQVYSLSWSESLARFDRDTFSWKTCQQSLPWGSTEFSWSSLRWGIVRAGLLSQPARLEPRTCAKDGGYMPTPTARDFKSPGVNRTRKTSIEDRRGIPLSLWFKETFGKNLHPSFVEWMMGYAPKHTACEPWAIQWFQRKPERLSCVSVA